MECFWIQCCLREDRKRTLSSLSKAQISHLSTKIYGGPWNGWFCPLLDSTFLLFSLAIPLSTLTKNLCTPHNCSFLYISLARIGFLSFARSPWVSRQPPCNFLMQQRLFLNLHTSFLKMDAECSSETSLFAHKTTRCHNPEDDNLNYYHH